MHWNMARFAEALLPAIHRVSPEDVEAAKAIVDAIPGRFRSSWHAKVRQKLGLSGEGADDSELIDSLFDELETHSVDFTSFFRALAMLLRGDGPMLDSLLPDRKSVVEGKSVSEGLDCGGGLIIKNKRENNLN